MKRIIGTIIKRSFSTANQIEPIKEMPTLNFDKINLEEYRDLDQKVKYKTGYSLMEVEPFPRMKLMELGQMMLERLRKEIPEKAYFRIFLEERTKYMMELVHETKNIKLLEKKFGTDCIEIVIESLAEQVMMIDIAKREKPWDQDPTTDDTHMYEMMKVPYDSHLRFEVQNPKEPKVLLKQ